MGDRGASAPARPLLILAIAAGLCTASAGAVSPGAPDIDTLLPRIAERVASYYRRAQTIVCVETSTVQPIATNWGLDGLPRTVESELRVESPGAEGLTLPKAEVRRDVRRINGRAPRERDKTARAGCTDPIALSPEPLAFLMPGDRDQYRFTAVRETRERDRAALALDFVSMAQRSRADLIEDERGHEDCFDWTGPIARRGRVWVDAATHDVLRVDRGLLGPVDLRVSWPLQRRHNIAAFFTLERDDVSMRFKEVAFSDPDEVILLPESIESLTLVRSGLQSTRVTATFTDYRRFVTSGRVKGR